MIRNSILFQGFFYVILAARQQLFPRGLKCSLWSASVQSPLLGVLATLSSWTWTSRGLEEEGALRCVFFLLLPPPKAHLPSSASSPRPAWVMRFSPSDCSPPVFMWEDRSCHQHTHVPGDIIPCGHCQLQEFCLPAEKLEEDITRVPMWWHQREDKLHGRASHQSFPCEMESHFFSSSNRKIGSSPLILITWGKTRANSCPLCKQNWHLLQPRHAAIVQTT